METEAQLRETFNQVLSDMKIQENFYIDEIYRLKSKTPLMPPSTAVYRPVKVRFLNKFQRSLFLKNLRNLDKFRNIKVTIDCPKALVPDYRIKDKIAYDIRTETPSTKTIVTIKNRKIVVLTKRESETKYSVLKDHTNEAQPNDTMDTNAD